MNIYGNNLIILSAYYLHTDGHLLQGQPTGEKYWKDKSAEHKVTILNL